MGSFRGLLAYKSVRLARILRQLQSSIPHDRIVKRRRISRHPALNQGEGSVKLVPVAAAAMVGILWAGPAEAQTRRYVGRPVADVLTALKSPKLRIFFTSDSVPQTLLVKSEPKGPTDRDIARQILAEHGLALKPRRGGVEIVVPAKRPAAAK